jgi:hypothetical protein
MEFTASAFMPEGNLLGSVGNGKLTPGRDRAHFNMGAMFNGANRTLLQNCLATVQQKVDVLHVTSKPIAIHFFAPMQAHGCTGHPNGEDHAVLAKELVPFFKGLL